MSTQLKTVKELIAMSKADLIEELLWTYTQIDWLINELSWFELCATHPLGRAVAELPAEQREQFLVALKVGIAAKRATQQP